MRGPLNRGPLKMSIPPHRCDPRRRTRGSTSAPAPASAPASASASTSVCEKNTPPENNIIRNIGFWSTKSGARAHPKGVLFSQTPVLYLCLYLCLCLCLCLCVCNCNCLCLCLCLRLRLRLRIDVIPAFSYLRSSYLGFQSLDCSQNKTKIYIEIAVHMLFDSEESFGPDGMPCMYQTLKRGSQGGRRAYMVYPSPFPLRGQISTVWRFGGPLLFLPEPRHGTSVGATSLVLCLSLTVRRSLLRVLLLAFPARCLHSLLNCDLERIPSLTAALSLPPYIYIYIYIYIYMYIYNVVYMYIYVYIYIYVSLSISLSLSLSLSASMEAGGSLPF